MLESADVATCEIDAETRGDLHRRYELAAIPMTVVADADGVVQRAFVGAFTATDLWAAVAEVRVPGRTPEPDLGHLLIVARARSEVGDVVERLALGERLGDVLGAVGVHEVAGPADLAAHRGVDESGDLVAVERLALEQVCGRRPRARRGARRARLRARFSSSRRIRSTSSSITRAVSSE